MGLVVMLFVVAALPLASLLACIGDWDEGSLGVSTLGVVLAGRELLASLFAGGRRGRDP